jgi:molybdopterin synthase catalytic subunit
MGHVEVTSHTLSPGALLAAFPPPGARAGFSTAAGRSDAGSATGDDIGAVVSFSGRVRGGSVTALELEHYPGMTERSIEAMVRSAARRWPLLAVQVVHRVGLLAPGETIVWLAVAAAHRAAAFAGGEYLMDYLKIAAPFWKRERDASGTWHWVEARSSDDQRAQRWGIAGPGSAGAQL